MLGNRDVRYPHRVRPRFRQWPVAACGAATGFDSGDPRSRRTMEGPPCAGKDGRVGGAASKLELLVSQELGFRIGSAIPVSQVKGVRTGASLGARRGGRILASNRRVLRYS